MGRQCWLESGNFTILQDANTTSLTVAASRGMNRNIKVYIADDHTLFRKGISRLLSSFERVGKVRDFENGKELYALIRTEPPDVAIIDLQMPVMDGEETCGLVLSRFPRVKLIVLSMHDDEQYIARMMEMGVHGFLLKTSDPLELEKAIYAVVDNDFYHNDLITSVLRTKLKERKSAGHPVVEKVPLSARETEILHLICMELTISEIGVRLSLSENTVRNHRVKMMAKIGVRNTAGLVKYAFQSGLIA